jgi:hypothetical protein
MTEGTTTKRPPQRGWSTATLCHDTERTLACRLTLSAAGAERIGFGGDVCLWQHLGLVELTLSKSAKIQTLGATT